MMNIQDKSLYNYAVIGERDRYRFLELLLKTEKTFDIAIMIQYDIIVIYGEDTAARKCNNIWEITTPCLTPLTSLYFPQNGLSDSLLEQKDTEYYLLLEGDPFRRQANISLLEKIRTKLPYSHIVIGLLDLPRHQAYTDMLPLGEELRLAIQKYTGEGYDTIVLKERNDVQKIFERYETTYAVWLRRMHNSVAQLAEKIKNDDIVYDFQDLWEDLPVGSIRFPKIQAQKICSYDYLKLHKLNDRFLWKNYVKGGYQTLFPSNAQGGVFEFFPLYRYSLEETNTAIWDIKNDEKILLKMLEEDYLSMFSKSEYNKILAPVFNDKSDYEKKLSDKGSILFGIRLEFSKFLSEFITTEILNCMVIMLKKRHRQLKELLNEQ